MQKKIIITAMIILISIVSVSVGIFLFQYKTSSPPKIPTDFTATSIGGSQIDLTWIKGENADTTNIESNTESPWKRGEGTLIYNDTGVSYQDRELLQNTHYYYQAWSWNQTKHIFSTTYAVADNTTYSNQPPIIGSPNPVNGSTNNPLDVSWRILISDPDGDPFSWTIECNNSKVNNETEASNGIKSLSLFNLSYSITYTVWVNATDPTGSGLYTRGWYRFTTKAYALNNPPVFGTPSPMNGSTGNLLSLSWSIPINDSQGNFFSWTIQCSNKQVSYGSGATNGTKTLSLIGLAYSITYRVWVNATDTFGSGQYTRRWYIFTTKTNVTNNPPVLGTPSPTNGSIVNKLSLNWSIPINDPEGDLFSWTLNCSNGQQNQGINASNGTKTLSLNNLANSTTYKVWVNSTDPTGSGLYTRRWYNFTTRQVNNSPPLFGIPSPPNGSTGNPLNLYWSIPINDPEGDHFSWTINCSNGQVISGTSATNGSKTLFLSGLTNLTMYRVWVNATDPTGSGLYTRKWYTLSTRQTNNNSPPVFGTPSPANGSTGNQLSLDWIIPINDPEGNLFIWTINCSNGRHNSNTSASNGTKSLSIFGLSYSNTYTVWVNATDTNGSGLYTRSWYTFTTKEKENNPPKFGKPTPQNKSNNNNNSFIWKIPISDAQGDPFSWTIQCSNGQVNNSTGTSNGTKELTLSGLAYSATYTVWVNATDPTGSGNYTRAWFTFTTKEQPNNPPNVPNTPSGETKGKIKTEHIYTTSTTDQDGDNVSYYWDWGDGTNSDWIGPSASGATTIAKHTWTKKGNYTIKVKAKDEHGLESDWATLSVTMPYSNTLAVRLFLNKFFERFLYVFPILRHLMWY